MIQIGFSVLDIFSDTLSFLDKIVNYIGSVIQFLIALISSITVLSVSFFVSLPSFISIGLGSVFSLGITILIIKLVRS